MSKMGTGICLLFKTKMRFGSLRLGMKEKMIIGLRDLDND